jgi:hypothetical protein
MDENMKLKVWTIVNVPNHPVRIPVDSIDEAKALIRKLVQEQLQDDYIVSNAFGLEEWDELDKEWLEWEDNDGFDIMAVIDQEDE